MLSSSEEVYANLNASDKFNKHSSSNPIIMLTATIYKDDKLSLCVSVRDIGWSKNRLIYLIAFKAWLALA